MIRNAHYITDAKGLRTAVILPVDQYEEITNESRGETFEDVHNFLKQQLVLSVMDKTLEFLGVPINHSSKRKGDCSLLLFTLVELFYYSRDFEIDRKNYSITLMDSDFSKFSISIEQKTIQTQRNENLIPYLQEHDNKSIVGINQHHSTSKRGCSYELDFLRVLEDAVNEFFSESNIRASGMIDIIKFSKRIKYAELEQANDSFKLLWRIITKHLSALSNKAKIFRSESALKSSIYQHNKNS